MPGVATLAQEAGAVTRKRTPTGERARVRTKRLSVEEVAQLDLAAEESWQSQLKDMARGKIAGFAVEIEPWDRVIDEKEAAALLEAETRNVFNAIRYHLKTAAERTLGDKDAWRDHVALLRTARDDDKRGRVRVFIRTANPPPQAFMDALAGKNAHLGRKAVKGRSVASGSRKTKAST